jgi:hypothetical protein
MRALVRGEKNTVGEMRHWARVIMGAPAERSRRRLR